MFTYTADPANSQTDAIRLMIGDVDEDEPQLEDEEITYLISMWLYKGSLYYVASMAAETIAARYTREISLSADSQSLQLGDLQQKYLSLAERLRVLHGSLLAGGLVDAGGILASEQPDQTVRPLSFGLGMHDDPEAGQQNYGGQNLPVWLPEIFGSY